ncbi:MAG: immune inhibitor A [Anaerolineae bacterium]|nr:immune inhibitor A [Anaerolineales bacterium]MCB8935818.1 immune inhibitor A [Promineifilum sp.]MCW5847403.1 immune inhibitor A [Anaerolineae bacterium]
MHRKLLAVLLLTVILLVSVSSITLGQGNDLRPADTLRFGGNGDDLSHPLGKQQRGLRQMALQQRLQGAEVQNGVMAMGPGTYVELEREDEDTIWTVLAEFGNRVHPSYGGALGPRHNEIPEPDRNVDNTTIWEPDFNRDYYVDTLFSEAPGAISMRNYYIEQSSGRYAVNGHVTDWGRVPYNTARYGNNACGSSVCATVWYFVEDSVNDWYQRMRDEGMSKAQINAYLSQFDVWDRYDFDGDGNFDEPDGYIDHFQSVHAGEGEETGGGSFGTDAIWSHRWYAFYNLIGVDGPSFNPAGGIQVGDSNYWIGDYTIEPENGAVGVFAHEFGHDLGLPDLYDTFGGENSTGFWTLMSSGSYGNDGTVDLGRKPTHMGAWEKFQLGWLDYDVAFAGERSRHVLGPAETTTGRPQGLFVVLPDKEVVNDLGDAYAGDYFYYSGSGNNLDHWMYREFDLPAGASISAQVRYQIEVDWDYAYLVASSDGGATWDMVETNLSTDTNPNGQNFGNGITGSSGGAWVELTADLSAYSGPTLLGFRYWTDVAAVEPGFMVDEINVSGSPVDGAESDMGWTFNPESGFRVTDGLESASYFNAYVAEYRRYWGFDDALRTGPYNFGFLNDANLQNWVERFSYQDGLLISYWDGSQSDNDTSQHPGHGLILPIDAHPRTMVRADGNPWRPRIQSYDSTFGIWRTDRLTLHYFGQPSNHPGQRAVRVFNDNMQYWNPETPTAGVMNPHTNTKIRIMGVSQAGTYMHLEVR